MLVSDKPRPKDEPWILTDLTLRLDATRPQLLGNRYAIPTGSTALLLDIS
jgi:hypothetical protein